MNKKYKKFITEYFIKNKIDIGPYTSRNIVKKYIFFERLDICLNIINRNFDKNFLVIDFGCGQGIFSLMLKINDFKNVVGIDTNLAALQQAKNLIEDFNENFGTQYKVDFSQRLEYKKIDLFCALDVFEHLTADDLESLISNLDVSNYLINLPTENFVYNMLNGFRKEPDHKTRYFDVINLLLHKGFIVERKKSKYSLFMAYYLKKSNKI